VKLPKTWEAPYQTSPKGGKPLPNPLERRGSRKGEFEMMKNVFMHSEKEACSDSPPVWGDKRGADIYEGCNGSLICIEILKN
jgi:hypothetical protein